MKKSEKGIQTLLGPESTLEGKLVFEGIVRLDGHFTGTVESKEGMVIIGEKGVINADILVHTAIARGEIRGNVRATNRIDLRSPARIFGDMSAPVIAIEPGVIFHGNMSMKPK
ncbi:MAG: polymer-forming cytoskeletal protein [Desulfobacterales bacterium]|nr:polymer-forming cytoskeletal protein [Desulfobacterales bacterium]